MDKMKTQFNVDNAWNKLHQRIVESDEPWLVLPVKIRTNSCLPIFPYACENCCIHYYFWLCWEYRWFFSQTKCRRSTFPANLNERGKNIVLA